MGAPGAGVRLRRSLTLVAGKGGVGKTTVASALAVYGAGRGDVLLLSTDPAHSLSDSLQAAIGSTPTPVGSHLWALQIEPRQTFDAFLERIKPRLHTALDRGTYFDDDDIAAFLALPLPGIDEVTALLELVRLLRVPQWDRIVLDTAPTGHTERLLRLPAAFAAFGEILDAMQERYRFMVSRLGDSRRLRSDPVEELIAELRDDVLRLEEALHDPQQTEVVLVCTPEYVVAAETRRYLEWLREDRLAPTTIVVNRVERRGRGSTRDISGLVMPGDIATAFAPEFHRAPRGPRRLRCLGTLLAEGWTPAATSIADVSTARPAPATVFPVSRLPLQFVVGKGGVGKSTIASLEALALAAQEPVLLVSLDPAHSLGDVWGVTIGDAPTALAPNLWGLEVDAPGRWEALRAAWQGALAEAATTAEQARLPGWSDTLADLQRVLDLMPPGIDEIMGLFALLDVWEQRRYRWVVVDGAPTGHLLRLIHLPELALEWVRMFMRLLLKYREVVRLTTLAEELIAVSRRMKAAAALLRDPEQCGFIPVTLAEALSVAETERLITALRHARMPVAAVVLNRLREPWHQRGVAAEQRRNVAVLQSGLDISVYRIPEYAAPVGHDALRALLHAGAAQTTPTACRS